MRQRQGSPSGSLSALRPALPLLRGRDASRGRRGGVGREGAGKDGGSERRWGRTAQGGSSPAARHCLEGASCPRGPASGHGAPGLRSVRRERRDSPPGNAESELNPRPGWRRPEWSAAPVSSDSLLRAGASARRPRLGSCSGQGSAAQRAKAAGRVGTAAPTLLRQGPGRGRHRRQMQSPEPAASRPPSPPAKAGFSRNRHPRTDASPPPGGGARGGTAETRSDPGSGALRKLETTGRSPRTAPASPCGIRPVRTRPGTGPCAPGNVPKARGGRGRGLGPRARPRTA